MPSRLARLASLALLAVSAALPAAEGTPSAGGKPALAEQRLSGIAHQSLYAVAFDGERGYAVGAHGEIEATADGGKTWHRQDSPTRLALFAVAARGGRVLIVGQQGTVLSGDGKGPWTAVDSGTKERLLGVALDGQGRAIAVGGFGTVIRSGDGGQSWAAASPAWPELFKANLDTLGEMFAPHLYTVSLADDGHALIAGELSTILRSADAGASWQVANSGRIVDGRAEPSLFALRRRGDGLVLAVGQAGRVLRSTDEGASWSAVESGSKALLLGLGFDGAGRAVIAGMREVRRAKDAEAREFVALREGELGTQWFAGVGRPADGGSVLLAGQFGRIVAIAD